MPNLLASTLVSVLVMFFLLTFSAPQSVLSANVGFQEVSRTVYKAGDEVREKVGDPQGEAAKTSLRRRRSPWYAGPPPPKHNMEQNPVLPPFPCCNPPPPPPPPSPPVY